MSNEANEAAEFAERAATQATHAAKNSGRAMKAVAEPVVEEVSGAVDDVMHTVQTKGPTMIKRLANMTGDAGVGLAALSVSLFAGAYAINQFRNVIARRGLPIK